MTLFLGAVDCKDLHLGTVGAGKSRGNHRQGLTDNACRVNLHIVDPRFLS
jgi:hypothetical protein